MRKLNIIPGAMVALCFAATGANAQTLKGPTSDKPFTENWAPSKWGPDDAAGSSNHTKDPANIKKALATIKQFKAIPIGKNYHREIPAVGARGWQLWIPGTPFAGPFGKNAMIYHDDLVIAQLVWCADLFCTYAVEPAAPRALDRPWGR